MSVVARWIYHGSAKATYWCCKICLEMPQQDPFKVTRRRLDNEQFSNTVHYHCGFHTRQLIGTMQAVILMLVPGTTITVIQGQSNDEQPESGSNAREPAVHGPVPTEQPGSSGGPE